MTAASGSEPVAGHPGAPVGDGPPRHAGGMPLRDSVAALRAVRRDDDVVITTMGTAREWMSLGPTHPLDLVYVPSSMGHATSVGLGLALARPDRRIIVCNGDGSMLMNLGSLVTIAAAAPLNLTALVFDNGAYEVTGGQPVPGARSLDFAGLARSSGFTSVFGFARIDEWRRSVRAVLDAPGPTFVVLDVAPVSGAPGPRSPGPAGERARRFIAALADEGPKVSTG